MLAQDLALALFFAELGLERAQQVFERGDVAGLEASIRRIPSIPLQ